MEVRSEEIAQLEKVQQYMTNMCPGFNRRALFSDTTGEYITLVEPEVYDKATIRFRTARDNVDQVLLVHQGNKYLMELVESNRPYNNDYDGWWGHNTLPKLNYEGSGELFDYVMYIAQKWVSPPFNADGWRLDVAADLGHSQKFNHFGKCR